MKITEKRNIISIMKALEKGDYNVYKIGYYDGSDEIFKKCINCITKRIESHTPYKHHPECLVVINELSHILGLLHNISNERKIN